MDIDKLKVAELRAELSSRGLDTKGTKPILLQRLRDAIQDEQPENEESAPASSEPTPEPEVVQPEAVEPVEEQPEKPVEEKPAEEKQEPEVQQEKPARPAPKFEPEDLTEEGKDAKMTEKTEEKKEGEEETKMEEDKPKEEGAARGVKRKLEAEKEEPFQVVENEPEIDDSVTCIDWFNSDLNLVINQESLLAGEPFYKEGWGFVWAGARLTYGFTSGKVCFEVKLGDTLDAKMDSESLGHTFRVGFASDCSSLQLGEGPHSFAYQSDAKKATDCKFESYGATFTKGDVVQAYLDLTGAEVVISFSKNGEDQGEAFRFNKETLEGKALFPSVATRNVKFSVNVGVAKDGSETESFKPLTEGFTPVGKVDLDQRVRGMQRLASRGDCELLLLVGLPASGKTTWAAKHVQENPDKRYYVIGTNALIEKMKVDGEPKKAHYKGKWDTFMQKCTRCLQGWLAQAAQRRRNYIIDQTNVYPNAQKRKVRPFEGLTRKAIVFVPSEEEYKSRAQQQEKAGNKDVPDNAVMEMKANMTLPCEGTDSPFSEITFVDLEREEATKIVEQYNKDAKEKGYGRRNEHKRMRGNMRGRGRMNMRGMRGGPMMMRGGPRGRFPHPHFRGGPGMRGMPPMRGGPPPPHMMRGGPPHMMRGGPPHMMPMRGGPFGGGGGGMRNNRGGNNQNKMRGGQGARPQPYQQQQQSQPPMNKKPFQRPGQQQRPMNNRGGGGQQGGQRNNFNNRNQGGGQKFNTAWQNPQGQQAPWGQQQQGQGQWGQQQQQGQGQNWGPWNQGGNQQQGGGQMWGGGGNNRNNMGGGGGQMRQGQNAAWGGNSSWGGNSGGGGGGNFNQGNNWRQGGGGNRY